MHTCSVSFLLDSVILQTLAHLLYEAASDCGYVDPKKIKEILGVSRNTKTRSSHSVKRSHSVDGEGLCQTQ